MLRQVGVHLTQILGGCGTKKITCGDLGHGLERLFINPGVKRVTLVAGDETVGRAKRHGVYAHAMTCRQLGHLDRIRPIGATAI